MFLKWPEVQRCQSFQWIENHSPKVRNEIKSEKQQMSQWSQCMWQPSIPRYKAGVWHLAQWLELRAGWGPPSLPQQQGCGQALGWRWGCHLDYSLRGPWFAMARNKVGKMVSDSLMSLPQSSSLLLRVLGWHLGSRLFLSLCPLGKCQIQDFHVQ